MFRRLMVVILTLALAGSGTNWAVQVKVLNVTDLPPAVQQQIAELIAEKDARTPTEQKVDSNLLYAFKQQSGAPLSTADAALQTGVAVDENQLTVVDITAQVTADLLARLTASGAKVLSSFPEYRSIRANVPIDQVLTIAGWSEVVFIQPKQEAQLADATESRARGDNRSADLLALISPQIRSTVRPDFAARAQRVQTQLQAALEELLIKTQVESQANVRPAAISQEIPQTSPSNRSEGDVAHRADLARETYGYIGTGVKVCVLSDGVDSLVALQASGDLPAVTVVPGQAGGGNEGAAMLEIVYDLAPGAQLFFATAGPSIAGFANNIKTLRNTYRCDVIVDDVYYFAETPFQLGQTASVGSNTNGGIVTQAVNEVVADGALYFSSAGNSGNEDDGTSGVWEGDFADGGAVAPPVTGSGKLLDFDTSGATQAFDTVTAFSSYPVTLFWSDPLGGSSNDYDLFLLDSAGTSVCSASTNVQNGTQDPFEQVTNPIDCNRLVVVQRTGAANRFLQVNTNRGQLQFNTPGQIGGHAAALGGFGVAAADAHRPAVLFSSSTLVEPFSSDGPRRYFFNPDSTPITPGNFSSTGGALAQKPDLTAADDVSCAAPGFNPFVGTSAAAPHAAAIAALLRSAKPSMTVAEARTILTSAPGAIDIQSPGWDRDSGAGVLNALGAMQALNPVPVSALAFSDPIITEGTIKNGNGVVDPGESFYMTVPLTNTTLTTATNVLASVELLNGSVGARVLQAGPVSYGTLAALSGKTNTATPFSVLLSPDLVCGTTLNFKNTVTYGGGGSNSPQVAFNNVAIGSPLMITTSLDVTAPLPFAGPPAYTTTTGTQTGRLARTTIASTCNSATSNPGLHFNDTDARQYDAFTFTNTSASSVCVSIKLSTPPVGGSSALFAAVYDHNGFVPATPDVNYLADAGNSTDSVNPVSFSFVAPAGQQFTVVVHELNAGAGSGAYSLEVSGAGFDLCSTVNSVSTYLPAVLK